MKFIQEEHFENLVIAKFKENDWVQIQDIKRIGKKEVINWEILKKAIININKTSKENAQKAIFKINKISNTAIESNIAGFEFLKNGIKVFDEKLKRQITLKLFSEKTSQNIFEIIRQFEITDGESKRIPDIVAFLNGMPISIIELKSPIANERIEDAFKQNESLKLFCSTLFTFNLFNVVSNQLTTKYGSITSLFKRYFRSVEWNNDNNFVKQLFNKKFVLKVLQEYLFFDNAKKIKYLAAPHQVIAITKTIEKLSKAQDNKGGVVWHTQGSGKSVTMLMLIKSILNKFPQSTILVVTDRNTLDKQLFERFSQSSNYLMSISEEVNSRQDLVLKLNEKKHFGIYFTTIQKFSTETGVLSNRDDIFILVDEAHRTQNNIDGEKILSKETLEFIMKFGYARYMRDAFPKAKLIGFTGTPLMGLDRDTTNIFGNYNHIYSMNDSVKDGSTVPIIYESRKININLNKSYLEQMDLIQQEYAKTLNPNDIQSQQKMDALLKAVRIKSILENKEVIKVKVKDILEHLAIRSKILHGKAMIVASTRKAAYRYYKEIIKQDYSRKESTILVVTHSNKDGFDMKNAIVAKSQINLVASEFRKSNSKYKIAIVVDMWLTGFDVPDLDVMYIDKIIKWHNLMQAIARVNRTYEDKESGLIVDYLGIWGFLGEALIQYANGKEKQFDIIPEDIRKAELILKDLIDVIDKNYLRSIKKFIKLNTKEQYKYVMDALEVVLSFSIEERTKFIRIARKIKRLVKITFTIITQEISTMAKAIEVVNSLLSTKNTLEDEELKITIQNIRDAIKKTIDSSTSDISISSTKINKDINEVAKLLEEEAEELREHNPLVAKKLLEDAINSKINFIRKIRPMFAKKVSEKLQQILSKIEKEEKLNCIIDLLIKLSKEITKKMNQKPEYSDPHLQAFFTIVADDKYLKRNKNSEVLRKIAEDLMEVSKNNSKNGINAIIARDKLEWALRKVLKNKYNYPPQELGGISGILIDKIKETIDFDPNYFVGKKVI